MSDPVNKQPETSYLVRFPDCDPFNHLNNARYLDYFMNAREDHLLQYYGFSPYQQIKESGESWVVVQNQIAYLRPALLMETVRIRSVLRYWGDKSILVEMTMWDNAGSRAKALLWSTFVHYNIRTQQSVPHSDELRDRFRHLEDPFPEPVSFADRVSGLR